MTVKDVDADLVQAVRAAVERRAELDWAWADRARRVLPSARPLEHPAEWDLRFDLDPLDVALLEVALAAEDPALHVTFGLLCGDDAPGRPTVALAAELIGSAPTDPELLARLGPLAPLVRHRLLVVDGGGPWASRRLRVPDRVVAQARGDDLPDPAVLPLLVDPLPMRLSGSDRVATGIAHGARLVWVTAAPGSAALSMAAGAGILLGSSVLAGDLSRLPATSKADVGERTEWVVDPVAVAGAVDRLVDEAALTGSVLILLSADLAAADMSRLRGAAVPVVAISAQAWQPRWGQRLPPTVAAPRLTLADRTRIWRELLPGFDVPRDLVVLRLTPEEIRETVRDAAATAAQDESPGLQPDHLRRSARRFGRDQIDEGERVTADDLILPARVRAEVERLLDWARFRDEVIALGPLHGKGKGSGIAALFAGSPGTGKTLAARYVADSLGIHLLQVDLATVVSKYVGESQKNLEQLFVEAESMNAILFFDEADALFGSRSNAKDAHDRYANQEVAYLLQRMESFDGITVLATNLRGNLDPAFARRLHFIVTFPEPDVSSRADLWAHHLGQVAMDSADPIDPTVLADGVELSGGEIRNVVLAAVYDAVARQQLLGLRHVSAALVRELTKLGRRTPPLPWLTSVDHRSPALLSPRS